MSDDHHCLHEGDIAGLCKDMVSVKESMQRVEKCILGNGNEGLMSRMSVIESNAKNMPSPRMLATLASAGGGVTVALIYLGIKIFS